MKLPTHRRVPTTLTNQPEQPARATGLGWHIPLGQPRFATISAERVPVQLRFDCRRLGAWLSACGDGACCADTAPVTSPEVELFIGSPETGGSRSEVLVEQIRAALTDDLLKPEWAKKPRRTNSAGHCYAASEALFHLLGGKAGGYTPMRTRHEGGSHWYLRTPDGTYLDPTSDQFETPVAYTEGVGCGFLTRGPSRRAAEVIRRLSSCSEAL